MSDSFLEMHSNGNLKFSFAGSLQPMSIRDQMVRAKMFVDRAMVEDLIGQYRPLFVVGAGAGGAAAAMYAASHGIHTTLIDKLEQPFNLQQQCTSRWIDPTQYDWPATHWYAAKYPWIASPDAGRVPLAWEAGISHDIAQRWLFEFRRFERELKDFFDFRPGMKFFRTDEPPPGGKLRVQFRPIHPGEIKKSIEDEKELDRQYKQDVLAGRETPLSAECGALLDARGATLERVCCNDHPKSHPGPYRGYGFWKPDKLGQRNFGFNDSVQFRRVLICGAGDGALQDFLRIATGATSVTPIMKQLEPHIGEARLRDIYSEEDQACRARVWNGKAPDHATMMRLDHLHREWVQELIAIPDVKELLDNLLAHSKGIQLELLHRCEHFTATYALNRFLVHLIVEFAAGWPVSGPESRWIRVRSGCEVSEVRCEGDGHGCPSNCLGKKHSVYARDFLDCRKDLEDDAHHVAGTATVGGAAALHDAGDHRRLDGHYEVVVLRLGLQRPDVEMALRKLKYWRHLLPYHSPI